MLPTIEVTELTLEEITLESPKLAPAGLIATVRQAIEDHKRIHNLADRAAAARVAACNQQEGSL